MIREIAKNIADPSIEFALFERSWLDDSGKLIVIELAFLDNGESDAKILTIGSIFFFYLGDFGFEETLWYVVKYKFHNITPSTLIPYSSLEAL